VLRRAGHDAHPEHTSWVPAGNGGRGWLTERERERERERKGEREGEIERDRERQMKRRFCEDEEAPGFNRDPRGG
jgi:hypothetical protein